MKSNSIAKRYAEALFVLVSAKDLVNSAKYLEALHVLVDLYTNNKQLHTILISPVITLAEKQAVIKDILSKLPPLRFLENFCFLLLQSERISLLKAIVEKYESYVNKKAELTIGIVTTAYSLEASEQKQLCKSLEVLSKNLLINYKVEEALLGGFILQIQDTIIDVSLRKRLENIRESIIKGGFYAN